MTFDTNSYMSNYEEIIHSKSFKDWFGDWENDPENSSKVVDANGKPKIMYHGSLADFDTFDITKTGKNWGGYSSHGRGIYLTDSYENAELWAKRAMGSTNDSYSTPKIYKVFLNIRNPYTGSRLAKEYYYKGAKSLDFKSTPYATFGDWGYDGYFGEYLDNYIAVAIHPNQIKAINNNGEFSTESDNIYEKRRKRRFHIF